MIEFFSKVDQCKLAQQRESVGWSLMIVNHQIAKTAGNGSGASTVRLVILHLTYIEHKSSSRMIVLLIHCYFTVFIIKNRFTRNVLHELASKSRFEAILIFVPVASSLAGGEGVCHSQQKHI